MFNIFIRFFVGLTGGMIDQFVRELTLEQERSELLMMYAVA